MIASLHHGDAPFKKEGVYLHFPAVSQTRKRGFRAVKGNNMKCTRLVKEGKCGRETGVACPPEWIKHQQFESRVLWILFEPMWGPDDPRLDSLNAFLCSKHLPEWKVTCARSRKALAAAQKRKAKKATPRKLAIQEGQGLLRFAAEERRKLGDHERAARLDVAADLLKDAGKKKG